MSAGKPEKGSPLALWKERLTELFHRYQYALLVVAAGVVLMVLPALGGESKAEEPQQESVQEVEFGTEELEGRLEEALSQMDGVGEAKVVLTLRSGPSQVLAQDIQRSIGEDQSQSTQSTVVISQGSGSEEAVVLQQLSPQYQGALVVCSGGDDPAVRLRVVEAVAALTGLGADKISVSKGK
ncbi:stage III sporulation protein AG [uncultured Flavonifractor sp.]|uniref:stage III sporulation protein AG n=1 Tax=uncultured Flavonifractor sp. TaxID=1193534 RepID=UPI002603CBBD|nr:stage III sporulation protein AG [uncultured Flavonifractor sp.]